MKWQNRAMSTMDKVTLEIRKAESQIIFNSTDSSANVVIVMIMDRTPHRSLQHFCVSEILTVCCCENLTCSTQRTSCSYTRLAVHAEQHGGENANSQTHWLDLKHSIDHSTPAYLLHKPLGVLSSAQCGHLQCLRSIHPPPHPFFNGQQDSKNGGRTNNCFAAKSSN